MANKFNLTAEINLRGPANIKTIVAGIRRELNTVTANVDLKVNPAASKKINAITKSLNTLNAAAASSRTSINDLNVALNGLSNSIQSVNSVNTKTVSTTTKTSSSMQSVAKSTQIATSKMEEFGKQSALAIKRFAAFSFVTTGVYAVINAVNQGVKAFINYDKQLVRLGQITGQTRTQLLSLDKTITQLATTFGVSSESLIGVADTLAQAGLTAEETRVALAALAKTELAPSFDNITKTTEGAIAALRQFGLEVSDLEAALGSINAVSARFAVESGDIIAAIQRTGGVFAAASKGVSQGKDALNEFIAVFTSVRATTRESAETIATGLRTIFTRIQRAGTIKQLKDFGVELQDLEGKFVGPFEAVRRLSEALNQLDPRDIRFSTIVEELGGFRQIGKVIPLIQQFATAQEALKIAQTGQASLSGAQIKSQQALAIQIAKVREEFLSLVRDIGQSSSFQALAKIILSLTSSFIKLVSAFKPVLPILAVIGAIKGVGAITKFAGGFFGAFKQGGGAGSAGRNIGDTLTGTKEKDRAEVTARAADAIRLNTDALKSLTSSVQSLENTIKSRGSSTFSGGGKVLGFNRGGVVPGSGRGDKVPAVLEPGEVVMSNQAAQKYGRGNLVRMNSFGGGGEVFTKKIPGSLKGMKDSKPIAYSDISKLKINDSGKGAIRGYFFENFVNRKFGVDAPENKFPDIPNLNIKKGLKQELGLTKAQTGRDFKAAELKYRSGLKADFNSQYTPENTAVLYAVDRANGGLIQKFMAGSPGGVQLGKGRGKPGRRGARYTFRELDETELANLSTKDLIKYANEQAYRIFSTAGAGMVVGNEFIEVPQERIIPELESELTTYLGKRGFWREVVDPFGSIPKTRASIQRKMDARTLRKMVATAGGVDSSSLENVPMDVLLKYAEQAPRAPKDVLEATIARYQKDPSTKGGFLKRFEQSAKSGEFISGKPLLDEIPDIPERLVAFRKSLEKELSETQDEKLRKSVLDKIVKTNNAIQEAKDYQKDILPTVTGRASHFAWATRQAIPESKNFANGGLVQKFMDGSVGGIEPTEDSLSAEDLYKWIASLGTAQEVRGLAGGNKYIDSELSKVKIEGGKRATSSDIFKKSFLLGPQSGPYLKTIQKLVTIADENKKRPRIFTEEEKANATNVGLVGMFPFGVDQLLYEQIGDKTVAIQMKSLTKDKALVVNQMRKDIDTVLGRGTQALYGNPGKDLDDPTKEALGLGNLEGYMIEAILARAGANPGKLNDRSVDYASGLGNAASLFGIDPNIPTEVKRDVKGGLSKARANFRNYFAKLAFGGRAEGPGFEEVRKQIMDKYPEIDFRISKRKRGFGYNLMGALKSAGGLSGDTSLNFQQPTNLKQLQEYSDKLAGKLMNPQELAEGGLAKPQKNFGQIALRTGNRIQATYIKEGEAAQSRSGQVIADQINSGLYAVQSSSATKGYGPKLYDIVMEAATAAGGMLTSDRRTVSDAAKGVWAYYFNNRSDVKKTPLGPENWVSNSRLLDEKLYGPPETWPSSNDPAWILQSGYSKSPSDINNPNLVQKLAAGGPSKNTVPAMVSNQEGFVSPKLAKRIGYAKLDRMNQADRNGMTGFAGGGISKFKGPGSGTSDSIGPIGLPKGSYVIRAKAMKAMNLNKGGSVGIQYFKDGNRVLPSERTLSKEERKRIKEQYLAEQRGGVTREEARAVGAPRPDFGAGASRRRDVMATPEGAANVAKIEAQVLDDYKKLYAQQKQAIDAFYDDLSSQARQDFFEGKISADELTQTLEDLFDQRVLRKSQAKEGLTTQAQAATEKAVQDYTQGKQTSQIEKRKTADMGAFDTEVKSAMDSVAKEAKAKYKQLYDDEKKSLKDFYQQRYQQVQAEGGDVGAVVAEYRSAVADAKQALEAGLKTEISQKQAQVPEKIAAQKQEQLTQVRETKVQEAENKARAADPFYDAKKAADEYAASVGNAAETSKQMAEEQKAYIEYIAREKGLSSKGLQRQLTKDVARESYQVKARSRFGQEELKAIAAGSSKTLKGKSVETLLETDTQEGRQIQDIVNSFEAKLKEINPSMENAREQATKLAVAMSRGDQSVQQIIASDEELNKILNTQISDVDAYNEAIRRGAAAAGISEEALKSLASASDVATREFAETPEGKRYGVLAELMPKQTKQFAESGLGKGLGKIDDFFSGKGGLLSKGAAKLGGFSGIATAATAAIPFAAESLLTKEQMKDPNIAGGLGAAQGALAMGAAGYEMAGGGIPGLIAAFGAALLGGIKGWFEGKNQAVFQNAMDKLAETTNGLEYAFKELEKEATPKNIEKFNKAAGDAFMAQQDLGNIAFSEQRNMFGSATSEEALAGAGIGAAVGAVVGSIVPAIGTAIGTAVGAGIGYLAGAFTDYYSKYSDEQISEAGAAMTNASISQYEMQTRGAEIKTSQLPIEEVDAMMAALNDGVGSAGPIVKSYADALRSTGKYSEDQIATISDEQSAIAAFLQVRKAQLGSEEAAVEELKKNKDASIKIGREIRDEQQKRMLKDNQLKAAIKQVAVASESLLDIYRRIGAYTSRYADELGDVTSNIKGYLGDLSGDTQIQDVDRSGAERVLGNISAYSTEQVKAAGAQVSGMLGNTEESKALANQATVAKILTDQLPALLRSNEGNRGAAVDQLEQLLSAQGLEGGAIDAVLEEIRQKVAGEEKTNIGTLIEDIDSGIISKFSEQASEGAKKLQELAATYNNTIQEFISLQNQQNQAILKANEYYRQAAQIRLNAELDLAKALGRNLSLQELNKPFEAEIGSLTQGLMDIGVLGADQAMDPAAIAAGIQEAANRNLAIEASQQELKGQFSTATDEGQRQRLNQAQLDNIQALGENKRAIEEGQSALQRLANDGSRAANALSKIQEQQKRVEAFGSALDQALTATPEDLAKMNMNTEALNRVLAGDTSGLKTSSGRRAAFAGLQQDRDLIGEEEYNKRLAVLRRQSLMTTQGAITPEQEKMLQRLEKGMPDEEDPNVKAYREAVAVQQEAAQKLGDLQMASADKIGLAMDDLRMFLQDKFPGILTQAITDARTATATATETGKPKETAPEVKAEQERRATADKEAETRKQEIAKAEKDWKTKSDRAARLDREATASESWGADPIGRGLATNAAEQEAEASARLDRLKAEDEAAKQAEQQRQNAYDTARKQQEQQDREIKAAEEARKASEDRAKTEEVLNRATGPSGGNVIPAPPAPGTRQATYTGTRAASGSIVRPTQQIADTFVQARRQQEMAQRELQLGGLGSVKAAKEEELVKKQRALKAAQIAAAGAGTLETSPKVAAAEEAVNLAKQDLAVINEQITAEKQRLAATAELAKLEEQGTQPPTRIANIPGQATPEQQRAAANAIAGTPSFKGGYVSDEDRALVPSIPRTTQTAPRQVSYTNQSSDDQRQRTNRQQTSGPTAGMGYSLTIDDKSVEFLKNLTDTFNQFGSYVDKLANLDLKIELTGNYTIDVNITGAAGLAAIDKSMRDIATTLIESKVNELRDEISAATRGAVKPSASKGTVK